MTENRKPNKPFNKPNHVSYDDVRKMINHANYTFKQKTEHMYTPGGVKKGSDLYTLQVDFAYLLNELQRGYSYRRAMIYSNILSFLEKIPTPA